METFDLKVLIEFSKTNSVSLAAKSLFLSQSSVSRSLNRIECDLDVPIFIHKKNKIELNENGELVVEKAKEIVLKVDELKEEVKNNHNSIKAISIGACSPLVRSKAIDRCKDEFKDAIITCEIETIDNLLLKLEDGTFDLIILPSMPLLDNIQTKFIFEETLCFTLPNDHKFSNNSTLKMSDLNGETILCLSNMGFWINQIKDKMPDSKFITIDDISDFCELVENSNIPLFNSFEAIEYYGKPTDKVTIKISDEDATVKYYLICLKRNINKFSVFFK